MTQTVPIRSDANFLALDSYMDTLLQEKGYKRLEQEIDLVGGSSH